MIISIKKYTSLLQAYVLSIVMLGLAGSLSVHASAPGNLSSPFESGSKWHICQGYNNSIGTHTGSSGLGLDFTGGPYCDSSANGRTIRAPLSGTVAWYSSGSGSICVSKAGGPSVMLTHIETSVTPGMSVTSGQSIGTIASPGLRQNNGVSHLHMQVWASQNCTGAQVPFTSALSTRICGAPDLPTAGPNSFNAGVWGGTYFVADSCSTTMPQSAPGVERFYNTTDKKHLFTSDVNEANILRVRGSQVWKYEGLSYWVKNDSACEVGEAVYRFYSERLRSHLYTRDETEKRILSTYPRDVWRYEGVAFCADDVKSPDNIPVYRFYSEQLKVHLYTIDENEKRTLTGYNQPNVWRYEGVSYYAFR